MPGEGSPASPGAGMEIGAAGTRWRSFRSTRNALRRVAAANSRRSLERGYGPFGSEARRFAASNLWTVRELGAGEADASGTSRLGSTSHSDTPPLGRGRLPRTLNRGACPNNSSSPLTGTPRCVRSLRHNSPRRSKVRSPPRRASDPKGPSSRSRRSLESGTATRRSALRVDRKKRQRVPATPMPILAPGEAGPPFRRFQKEGQPGSSWHLQRLQKEQTPGIPRTSHSPSFSPFTTPSQR